MIFSERNVPQAKELFKGMVFKVFIGSQYLWVFLGNVIEQKEFLVEKVKVWVGEAIILSGVAWMHLQEEYKRI